MVRHRMQSSDAHAVSTIPAADGASGELLSR